MLDWTRWRWVLIWTKLPDNGLTFQTELTEILKSASLPIWDASIKDHRQSNNKLDPEVVRILSRP